MVIRWDSESDWINNQDSSGTTGRNDELKQGYSRDRPDLSADLVGYWPLSEDAGTKAYDLSGNDNHGSLNGGVTQGLAGKGGLTSYSFDGKDDYIDLGNNINPNQITISGWIFFNNLQSADTGLVSKVNWNSETQDNEEYGLRVHKDGYFQVVIGNGDGFSEATYDISNLESNVWYFFTGTYDGSHIKLFVDADLKDTAQEPSLQSGTNKLLIAGEIRDGNPNNFVDGKIQDVRIYDRALSESEIKKLYNWGSGNYARPPKDGIAYYKMDGDGSDSWSSHSTTNSGVVFSSDAVRGQSGDFQASDNDRLVIDNSGDSSHPLNIGNLAASDFTVSAWAKFESFPNTNNDILGSYDGSWYLLWYNTDRGFRWGVDDSSNNIIADGGTAETGEWYHITGTYENSKKKVKLYLNGSSIAENTNTSFSAKASSNPVHIGDGGSGRKWPVNGHIDNVRIYDRELRSYEISELYRYGTRGRDMRKQLVNY